MTGSSHIAYLDYSLTLHTRVGFLFTHVKLPVFYVYILPPQTQGTVAYIARLYTRERA